MEIKKLKDFVSESTVGDITRYELKNKDTEYSGTKKYPGKTPIRIGDETKVTKIDIKNIQKTYPNSEIYNEEGIYYLLMNESKIGNKIIEIYEKIANNLDKDKLKNSYYISQEEINKIAKNELSEFDYNFYLNEKDSINNMLKDEFLVKIYEESEKKNENFDIKNFNEFFSNENE